MLGCNNITYLHYLVIRLPTESEWQGRTRAEHGLSSKHCFKTRLVADHSIWFGSSVVPSHGELAVMRGSFCLFSGRRVLESGTIGFGLLLGPSHDATDGVIARIGKGPYLKLLI